MKSKLKTKICDDIIHCAFVIIQEAQWHKRIASGKCLRHIGAMVWQITRGLVALKRRL